MRAARGGHGGGRHARDRGRPRHGPAGALARVLDDPVLAAQMGAEALRRSEADYTWAANARRMEDVYAAVVQG